MQYRNLGRSGLKVSEISLGSWISMSDPNNFSSAAAIIDAAYAQGINFFDTAATYHGGVAEHILGKALKKYPRESYVIATKVYFPQGEGVNNRGLSRKHIFEQVKKSLGRLGTDYIDLLYCHWYDPETPVEETMRAMSDLVANGTALYTGVSNWTAAQISNGCGIAHRLSLYGPIANQPSYNLLDRYIEQESIPLCQNEGIGLVAYSPLAQGVLTGKYAHGEKTPPCSRASNPLALGAVSVFDYLTDDILDTVEKLKKIADGLQMPLSTMALAWVLRLPAVASALIGASNPEQVALNAGASGIQLPEYALCEIETVLSQSRHSVRHNIVPWSSAQNSL